MKNSTITVASWNILYDHSINSSAYDQSRRSTELIQKLKTHVPDIDVLGLCEVEGNKSKNTGQEFAKHLNLPHITWQNYGRKGEGLSLLSRLKPKSTYTTTLDTYGDNRPATISLIDQTAIAMTHFSWPPQKQGERFLQATDLCNELTSSSTSIIMGDFNSLSWQKPRKHIKTMGYRSVIEELNLKNPTAPIGKYKYVMVPWWFKPFVVRGFSIDDIYYRGLKLESGGLFTGASDHACVYATFSEQ